MSIKLVTGATDAPVSLATALRFCRALEQDVDMVWLLLQAAVEKIEDYTGRSLITKTFCLELDGWPNFCGGPIHYELGLPSINLPRTPLTVIDHVKYYSDTVLTTLSSDNYRADTARIPGRLVFADGISLPTTDVRHDAVQIQFKAGYGTKPGTMPPTLRTAVLMLTHHWFDKRRGVDDVKGEEVPMSLRGILHAYKVETTK
jgi:uncharacterized phiE125 gp8 family phage protein